MLALVAVFAFAAPALAAEPVVYPPDLATPPAGGQPSDVRDFDDSQGGWTADVRREPALAQVLCALAPLTCPSVTNGWAPSGGAGAEDGNDDPDGYLRTQIFGVAGIATRTIVNWRSPAFTWAGVPDADDPPAIDPDDQPTEVTFTFDRLVRLGALLDVAQGRRGEINVFLDNVDTGASLQIVDGLELTNTERWTSLPTVNVAPGDLTLGDDYRIRIETIIDIPVASVLPDGEIGYDNVRLTAFRPDPADQDSDGDGILDGEDNCIFIPNQNQQDTDGDGVGDLCDPTPFGPETDVDNDGIENDDDNCIFIPNPQQTDTDGDGVGDLCDPTPNGPDNDLDDDGINNNVDNCPTIQNPNQADADNDGVGDVCDPTPNGPDNDADNDGINDDDDNCPTVPNANQNDADNDGVGDLCDPTPNGPNNDIDEDGVPNGDDNCPTVPNPTQADADNDGVGDACDPTPNGPPGGNPTDPDGDGVPTPQDNCPTIPNPGQEDSDSDGVGDACDPTPNGPEGGQNPRGGEAFFDGRRLFIKLKCFGVSKAGKCISRATAFKARGGTRYTFPIERIVPAKGGKVIRARVRFQFREELEQRETIVLKSVLREDRRDRSKTTKYKTLRLIDRTQED